MIGRLRGQLIAKQPPALLIEVAGVGYEIFAPMPVFYDLPSVGQEVVLHTHLAIREDAHVLYGFAREQDRTLFRQLIKVSGIGPKLALAILSGMPGDEFINCLRAQDTTRLTRVPGIGKKTAERLCVEMRDRLPDFDGDVAAGPVTVTSPDLVLNEATQALVSLGYKPAEVSRMLTGVETRQMTVEQIIRMALQSAVSA